MCKLTITNNYKHITRQQFILTLPLSVKVNVFLPKLLDMIYNMFVIISNNLIKSLEIWLEVVMNKKFLIVGIVLGTMLAVLTPNTFGGLTFALMVGLLGGLISYKIEKKQSI